ncbi:HD domain-containing protein [Lipomyces oligophaga]|uniref:HD domain-containing protein n=1 Tax=Lipomyces oligophaga TaxID=45792 RepID=UPI0034CDC222
MVGNSDTADGIRDFTITENIKDGDDSKWKPTTAIPDSILRLPAPLSFFRILRFLKTQKRTGWLDRGVSATTAESISDHMYRMAVMAMLAPAEENLDSRKCAIIALVHDLAEAVVGDLTPDDPVGPDEKHRRERITMEYLADQIRPLNSAAADELYTCYMEYENSATPEARFVKDLDKFEFLLQTTEYQFDVLNGVEDKSVELSDFMAARSKIKHPLVKQWLSQLEDERKVMFTANST